jgi:hypothetical protein
MEKRTNKTKEARLWMIINDICKGQNNMTIIKKYTEEWKIGRTNVQNLITEAYEFMKLGDTEYSNELRQINIKRLEEIYADSLDRGDSMTALKALDLVNKTSGLYTTKVELGGNTVFQYEFAREDNNDEEDNEDKD